jgi:anion-transporting  ArsA/GET3 family ATPase
VLGGPKPTEDPIQVTPNLWVTLLTPAVGHLRFLQDSLPVRLLADAAMRSQGLKKFLAAAPGFSDMGVMYRMLDLVRRRQPSGAPAYDHCIIDSPATGHALALAQIPEFLARVIPGGPIARAAKDGLGVLTDPAMTGALIVTLPETLPVTEALELKAGLARHRFPVTAVVVNRVPVNPFSSEEHSAVRSMLPSDGRTVFGARELKRIERAQGALALLDERAPGAYVPLAEVPGAGQAAAENLVPLL